MSELMIIFLSASVSVVTTIITYGIVNLILKPVEEYRKEVRSLSNSLIKYGGVFKTGPNDGELNNEASQEFKSASINLQSAILAIPIPGFFRLLHLIPSEDDFERAYKSLTVVSAFANQKVGKDMHKEFNFAWKTLRNEWNNIEKYLKIKKLKIHRNEETETVRD